MRLLLNGPGQLTLAGNPPSLSRFLQVKACGICHSDRKAFHTPPKKMKFPRVLGHEVSGILTVDLPRVHLYAGDRVALWPALSCGTCYFCSAGRDNLCPEIKLFGYHLNGGFADNIALPEQLISNVACFKLADSLAFQQATLAEPLACVLNGLKKSSRQPDSILILGAGLMGRLCSRACRFFWAKANICLYDTNRQRRILAESDGGDEQMQKADLVFIAASDRDAFYCGLQFLQPGGSLILFSGLPGETANIKVNHNDLHRKEQTFYGAYGCLPLHIEQALSLIADGSIKVDDLITQEIQFNKTAQELTRKQQAHDYKSVIFFE